MFRKFARNHLAPFAVAPDRAELVCAHPRQRGASSSRAQRQHVIRDEEADEEAARNQRRGLLKWGARRVDSKRIGSAPICLHDVGRQSSGAFAASFCSTPARWMDGGPIGPLTDQPSWLCFRRRSMRAGQASRCQRTSVGRQPRWTKKGRGTGLVAGRSGVGLQRNDDANKLAGACWRLASAHQPGPCS